jgi:8-oxo-dGTP pyrophosphatase MutT (NUDIX family)
MQWIEEQFQKPFAPKAYSELDAYVRQSAAEARLQSPHPRESAVLILIHPHQGDGAITLIKRPIYEGVHSGQMAFPGGKKDDSDESLLHTALREVHEEVGIQLPTEKKYYVLNEIFIPPSQLLVQPFATVLDHEPIFIPNENEVAQLVPIPLAHFGASMKTEQMEIFLPHIQEKKTVPAIRFEEYLIWGATAMMLFELRDRLDLKNKYE